MVVLVSIITHSIVLLTVKNYSFLNETNELSSKLHFRRWSYHYFDCKEFDYQALILIHMGCLLFNSIARFKLCI
jgi:hypothetical protein